MSLTVVAVMILLVCGSAVTIAEDWRLRLIALVFAYGAVAMLMALEILPALGIVRLVAGVIAALILLQSLRHTRPSSSEGNKDEHSVPSLFLRIACVLFASVASLGLAQTYPLPTFPRNITIGIYWLVFTSISSLVLSRDVARVGFALLMLELAAALLVGVMVDTANLARFLLASLSSIILALAVSFLVGLDQRIMISDEVES